MAANQTQIAAPQKRMQLQLKDLLESRRQVISEMIPIKWLTPDRLIKVALLAVSKSPQLQICDANSIVRCAISCAELGLEPNTPMGLAYLVPFKNKGGMDAQLIVGYRGLIDLGRRTGDLSQIEAHPVRDGDKFRVRFGLDPLLEHEPSWAEEQPGVRAFYALARLSNGERQVEVMSKGAVDLVRKRSRAKDNGPWVTDYDEMGKKTVVRRMMKYLPMNPHLSRAMELDADRDDVGEPIELNDAPEPAASKTERLKRELAQEADVPPAEETEPAAETQETPEPGAAG